MVNLKQPAKGELWLNLKHSCKFIYELNCCLTRDRDRDRVASHASRSRSRSQPLKKQRRVQAEDLTLCQ